MAKNKVNNVSSLFRYPGGKSKLRGEITTILNSMINGEDVRIESLFFGGGLSDSRNGLNKLFDLVIDRKINRVIIENKDRLTRYQFNVLNKFFKSYNVEIETIDNKACTDEEELTNDIMMLMAVFSGRLYGRRSAKRRM